MLPKLSVIFKNAKLADPFKKLQSRSKESSEEYYSLQSALDASKKAVLQGSVDKLLVNLSFDVIKVCVSACRLGYLSTV